MQDDLDEVRRFIVASEPKVGSTFDATTDFTVGTTEVYDGEYDSLHHLEIQLL